MTNADGNRSMRIVVAMTETKYDLEERTAVFGESIIDFVKSLPADIVNNHLVGQVVRSATSIGANYMEADGAVTKKDFKYKIALCRKETKETKYNSSQT